MIPPICFCRGQALFVSGLSCYDEIKTLYSTYWGFNALTGLSCYLKHTHLTSLRQAFQCPHGLELLRLEPIQRAYSKASFNALSGLSCYCDIYVCIWHKKCFNALSGLYLISTGMIKSSPLLNFLFQCPLGLIPHFYSTPSKT